jgi:predicted nucleic acid-binding protein
VIYFDTSALLKLVHREAESAALIGYIRSHSAAGHVSSELVRAEIVRALARLNYDDQGILVDRERYEQEIGEMGDLLQEIYTIGVSTEVLIGAAGLKGPFLRTLDAIHLATATRLGGRLTAFVTYDQRLAAAAADAGLPVASPA